MSNGENGNGGWTSLAKYGAPGVAIMAIAALVVVASMSNGKVADTIEDHDNNNRQDNRDLIKAMTDLKDIMSELKSEVAESNRWQQLQAQVKKTIVP